MVPLIGGRQAAQTSRTITPREQVTAVDPPVYRIKDTGCTARGSAQEVINMKLSSRFLVDSLFVVAGAFLAVIALAWTAGPAGWTAFGVFTGITVIAAASAALARRGSVRFGHGL